MKYVLAEDDYLNMYPEDMRDACDLGVLIARVDRFVHTRIYYEDGCFDRVVIPLNGLIRYALEVKQKYTECL